MDNLFENAKTVDIADIEEILTVTERVSALLKTIRYVQTDEINFKKGDADKLAGVAEEMLENLCLNLSRMIEKEEEYEE